MDVEKLKARLISLNDDKNNEKIMSFLRTKLPFLQQIYGVNELDDIYAWDAEEDCFVINCGISISYEMLCYDDVKFQEVCDKHKEEEKIMEYGSALSTLIRCSKILGNSDIKKEKLETVLKGVEKEDILNALSVIKNLINS